jgi:hypothetical protein
MKVFKSLIENTSIFLICEDTSGNVYQSKTLVTSEAEYVAMLGRLKMHPDDKVMLNDNITVARVVYTTLARRIADRAR